MATLPDPTATLTGDNRTIYEDILMRRKAKGVDHLGPYIPLLNHPRLAKLIEQLGYYYKYESTLPREIYQFVVLILAKRSASPSCGTIMSCPGERPASRTRPSMP